MRAFKKVFDFLASYGFSCVLFVFLLLLTFLGTLYQVEHGLFAAQKEYFESIVLVHYAFGSLPVPLPGGYLLISLLFINMLFGGFVRAGQGWVKIGVIITHFGMCLLLLGSLITYKYSESGHLRLLEGESASEFISYHEWEVALTGEIPGQGAFEYAVPQDQFIRLTGGKSRTFTFGDFPVQLVLSGYEPNAMLQEAGAAQAPAGLRLVGGRYLNPLPNDRENERNLAGIYAKLVPSPSGGSEGADGILWGGLLQPTPSRWAGSNTPSSSARNISRCPSPSGSTILPTKSTPAPQWPKCIKATSPNSKTASSRPSKSR